MTKALIVIDVQESFRHRPYFSEAQVGPYLARQNALIAGCERVGVPVVRILHVDGPKAAANPFAVESGLVRPMEGLMDFEAAASFQKTRHSALVGTGLDVWLVRNGVQRIIVSGIRTEQCCETTARHASDLGFAVDFVAEATHTFDMQHLDGSALPAVDMVRRTAAVLKDRFARICTVGEALDRAASPA